MKLIDVLKKHGIEDAEVIKSVEEYVDATLAVKSENMIPKSRFDEVVSQRNNLKADISEREAEIAAMKEQQIDVGEISKIKESKAELEKKVYEIRASEWEKKSSLFTTDNEELKNRLEKIKDEFVVNDQLTLDQIEQNLKAWQRYEKIDYFSLPDIKPSFDSRKPTSSEKLKVYDPFRVK
jgi:hypothetical protein